MTTPKISYMNLLEALQSGDKNLQNRAFKELYLDVAIDAKVDEWARNYNLQNKTKTDILQEAVIILYKKIVLEQGKKFAGDSALTTYFLGICRMLILSATNKRSQEKYHTINLDNPEVEGKMKYDLREDLNQSEEEAEMDSLLNQALQKLTDTCQEALKLYYREGLSGKEVAEKQGLKNAHEANRKMGRCRTKLRELILADDKLVVLRDLVFSLFK